MLKQVITMFNSLKNKIMHGSSVKVVVLLNDLCQDLILPFNLKLYNFNYHDSVLCIQSFPCCRENSKQLLF